MYIFCKKQLIATHFHQLAKSEDKPDIGYDKHPDIMANMGMKQRGCTYCLPGFIIIPELIGKSATRREKLCL